MPKGNNQLSRGQISFNYNNNVDSNRDNEPGFDTVPDDIPDIDRAATIPTNPSNNKHIQMNEAIAFISMIDSNINGRLQDLFHDTNYQFSLSPKQQLATSFENDGRSSTKGFQSDDFFGNERTNTSGQHQQFRQPAQPQQASAQSYFQFQCQMTHPSNQAVISSDTDSSPELPRSANVELDIGQTSTQSTPANFQHHHFSHNSYSPDLKYYQDHPSNYSVPPSVSENSYSNNATCSSYSTHSVQYFQAPIPFNVEKGEYQSSLSSNPVSKRSSNSTRPSNSTSSTVSIPIPTADYRCNSNDSLSPASPDSTQLTEKRKKPINLRGGTCHLCGRVIRRDMSRHMRIHEEVSRFKCVYPKNFCIHKTGFFNRQYDFKKHLLHFHFEYDEPEVKKFYSLSEKLPHWGTCNCGQRFTGGDWLKNHILTDDEGKICPHLQKLKEVAKAETDTTDRKYLNAHQHLTKHHER